MESGVLNGGSGCFFFTRHSEVGREILRSGRVFGDARVVAAVTGGHRFDLQDAGTRTEFGGRYAHHGRLFEAVERPADVDRQIALADDAADLNVLAGCELVVAEAERRDFRTNWHQKIRLTTQFFDSFSQILRQSRGIYRTNRLSGSRSEATRSECARGRDLVEL